MVALPGAVLFACNFNRVRSPMAEALLKLAHGRTIFVDSVGLKREPGETEVDPFAAAVIDELGGDLHGFKPKVFDDLEDESFDLVVSLTPEAQHRAVELARGRAVDIEYWPTLDPTLADGSREQRLDAYRQVRDELARRIRERFGRASTFGG
ncbi:low molecular weight phosphatase family protein [Caulobacter mirabilis]|uniref:Low molecular weight phosphatase family protein n=1 Tax=Caulobacter mirabilis TaxID=69666 RepID=A0A2D2AZU2_9CAUL|nr:low molecular weight phosphatase family protein [Caulobacter mirabilis]ATQ43529.1 low molecular weight phosphatase family protein [Caulobacter mirabilis]